MTDDHIEEQSVKSKTQIKREMRMLRDTGKELVDLTPSQLEKLPISEELKASVLGAKKLKMKALKRQLQHIGVLMRDEDSDAIRKALDTLYKSHKEEVQEIHEVECWRDRLIAGEDGALNELFNQYEMIDRQYVMQLIRNANKEKKLNKPPKSARVLYKYLFDLTTGKNNA